MEELKLKKDILLQALATFEEALIIMDNPKYEEIYKTTRDSAIQRFEYTIDTFSADTDLLDATFKFNTKDYPGIDVEDLRE